MAVITYSPGIETVSGSMAKPKKLNGHNHGNYVIATHRVAATENPNCSRFYIRSGNTYVRTNQPNANETWARTRFQAVVAAVKARKGDLEYMTTDQANFIAQRDLAGGKKTMKAYLWKVCGDIYDQAHPRA